MQTRIFFALCGLVGLAVASAFFPAPKNTAGEASSWAARYEVQPRGLLLEALETQGPAVLYGAMSLGRNRPHFRLDWSWFEDGSKSGRVSGTHLEASTQTDLAFIPTLGFFTDPQSLVLIGHSEESDLTIQLWSVGLPTVEEQSLLPVAPVEAPRSRLVELDAGRASAAFLLKKDVAPPCEQGEAYLNLCELLVVDETSGEINYVCAASGHCRTEPCRVDEGEPVLAAKEVLRPVMTETKNHKDLGYIYVLHGGTESRLGKVEILIDKNRNGVIDGRKDFTADQWIAGGFLDAANYLD